MEGRTPGIVRYRADDLADLLVCTDRVVDQVRVVPRLSVLLISSPVYQITGVTVLLVVSYCPFEQVVHDARDGDEERSYRPNQPIRFEIRVESVEVDRVQKHHHRTE